LSLSLNDFRENLGFLFFELRNLVFKFDALVLKFLQLLFELVLDVLIIVEKLFLLIGVLVEKII
jgi:hypothetical protein